MGEIAVQLEKEDGFIENVKGLLIPVLNRFLAAQQLEVTWPRLRPRKKQGKRKTAAQNRIEHNDA